MWIEPVPSAYPLSLDPGQDVAASLLPVVEESLGRQIAPRDEFTIDVEDPARMDIVQQNMAAALAPGDPNAIAHVGAADFVGMAAVDMKNIERKLGAAADVAGGLRANCR